MFETLNPTPRRVPSAPPSLAQARRPLVDTWWSPAVQAMPAAAPATAQLAGEPPAAAARPGPAACGPDLGPFAAALLDEIDYPMLLLGPDGNLLHANKLARTGIEGEHPLRIEGHALGARSHADAQALAEAVLAARTRGLRRLLHLGRETARAVSVAVVPLAAPEGHTRRAVLLLLAKHQVCETLSAQAFARCHGLTPAETTVLQALCDGEQPLNLARTLGVAISTVRSQISSIRAKTGAASIRALVRQVAVLPPLVSLIAMPVR